MLNARIDELQRVQLETNTEAQATASTRAKTLPTEEAYDDDGDEEGILRLAAFEARLRALETSNQTAKLHTSKTSERPILQKHSNRPTNRE